SMPPDLDAEIAAAAARAGMSYSAWLADTARKEFTIRAGLAAVSQYEHSHGTFTPEELSAAEEWAAKAVQQARRAGSSTRRRTAGWASPTTPALSSPLTRQNRPSGR